MVRSLIAQMATPRKPLLHSDDDTPEKRGEKRPLDDDDDDSKALSSDHAWPALKEYIQWKIWVKIPKGPFGNPKKDKAKEDELFVAWLCAEGGIMAKLTQVSIEDPEFATGELHEMLGRLLTDNPSLPLGKVLDDAGMREHFSGDSSSVAGRSNGASASSVRGTTLRVELIDPKPMAAGTIAQVHAYGEDQVLKLAIVQNMSKFELQKKRLDSLVSRWWAPDIAISIHKIIDKQFPEWLKEFNMAIEAERMIALAADDELMRQLSWIGVGIPQVLDYSDKHLLMTRVKGVHYADLPLKKQVQTLRRTFQSSGICLFRNGSCHCDCHPGNLLVVTTEEGDKLIIVDHGMYAQLCRDDHLAVTDLFLHLLWFENFVRTGETNPSVPVVAQAAHQLKFSTRRNTPLGQAMYAYQCWNSTLRPPLWLFKENTYGMPDDPPQNFCPDHLNLITRQRVALGGSVKRLSEEKDKAGKQDANTERMLQHLSLIEHWSWAARQVDPPRIVAFADSAGPCSSVEQLCPVCDEACRMWGGKYTDLSGVFVAMKGHCMGAQTMPSASLQLCQLLGTSSHVTQHTLVHDEPLQSLQVVSQMAKCSPQDRFLLAITDGKHMTCMILGTGAMHDHEDVKHIAVLWSGSFTSNAPTAEATAMALSDAMHCSGANSIGQLQPVGGDLFEDESGVDEIKILQRECGELENFCRSIRDLAASAEQQCQMLFSEDSKHAVTTVHSVLCQLSSNLAPPSAHVNRKLESRVFAVKVARKPSFTYSTEKLMERFLTNRSESLTPELRSTAHRLFDKMGISSRSIIPYSGLCSSRTEGEDLFSYIPELDVEAVLQNQIKEKMTEEVLKVTEDVLAEWGGDRKTISGLVVATDSKLLIAPVLLMKLGLQASTQLVQVTDMGCCGGYQSISLCAKLARAAKGSRILLVMLEATGTQHCARQATPDRNDLLQFATFGDGFGAAIVGSGDPQPHEMTSPNLVLRYQHDLGHFDSSSKSMIEHKYLANAVYSAIHPNLPEAVLGNLTSFLEKLTAQAADFNGKEMVMDGVAWALHPECPKIVQKISEQHALTKAQVQHSWDVLRNHGNMSGVTNLAVLDYYLTGPDVGKHSEVLALSFGPGLCLHGIVFTMEM